MNELPGYPSLLFTVVSTLIAVPLFSLSVKNIRSFWRLRPLPKLPSSPDVYRAQEREWWLRERRWPRPDAARDGRPMDPAVAHAYSRLAASRARTYEFLAAGVLILGAAWLGTTVQDIPDHYLEGRDEAMTRWEEGEVAPLSDLFDAAGFLSGPVAPIMPIALGLMLRFKSSLWRGVRETYENEARRPRRERERTRRTTYSRRGLSKLLAVLFGPRR
jgi:hypothetical protein